MNHVFDEEELADAAYHGEAMFRATHGTVPDEVAVNPDDFERPSKCLVNQLLGYPLVWCNAVPRGTLEFRRTRNVKSVVSAVNVPVKKKRRRRAELAAEIAGLKRRVASLEGRLP